MENWRFKVDNTDVKEAMAHLDFSTEETKRAYKRAFSSAASMFKRAVGDSLMQVTSDPRKKEGIKTKVFKKGNGFLVHITEGFYLGGDRKKPFSLCFFEQGIKRTVHFKIKWYWRKGDREPYKGVPFEYVTKGVPRKPFFYRAVKATSPAAHQLISTKIREQITKIANGK